MTLYCSPNNEVPSSSLGYPSTFPNLLSTIYFPSYILAPIKLAYSSLPEQAPFLSFRESSCSCFRYFPLSNGLICLTVTRPSSLQSHHVTPPLHLICLGFFTNWLKLGLSRSSKLPVCLLYTFLVDFILPS